jgi:murein DD-endopeptidase MepM/ murein hydrolase activator NlpD
LRQPAHRQILTLAGALAMPGLSVPAWANAAVEAAAPQVAEAAPLSAHYDSSRRILFIGAGAPAETAPVGEITVSRASDLVGRQLRLVWTARSGSAGSGALPTSMPVAARMSSGFGLRTHPTLGGTRMHSGIDLAAAAGTPIVATSDGRVDTASWNGGYGLFVSLDHGGGVETRYGHMSRLNVAAGQEVRKGQVIGYVGSTGRSTGPHLHYEVRKNGRPVNPGR